MKAIASYLLLVFAGLSLAGCITSKKDAADEEYDPWSISSLALSPHFWDQD
jgi:hypothetical protein